MFSFLYKITKRQWKKIIDKFDKTSQMIQEFNCQRYEEKYLNDLIDLQL